MDGDAAVASVDSDPLPPPDTALRRRSSATSSFVLSTKLTVSVPSTSPNGSPRAGPPDQQHEFVLTEATLAAPLPIIESPLSPLTYTSLRDLLPQLSSGAINSPTAASSASSRSGYEISIRNRLVKQAAWAYLQPMSVSPGSTGSSFLQRLWLRLCSSVNSCLNFIGHDLVLSIAKALYRILRSLLCFTR